jgi:hypothetical protein
MVAGSAVIATAGLGCLGLASVTFLGLFSIGVFLLPADVAAGLACSGFSRDAPPPDQMAVSSSVLITR